MVTRRVKERVTGKRQGLLVHKWAPQLEILSHKSTGAFLSHCGWNSALESLCQGVPIIGWPLAGEQAHNSKMLEEEMGVCVELARGVQSTVVRLDVERIIELVVCKKGKGEEMKRKAMEISGKIRDAVREEGNQKGSSLKALEDFQRSILLRKRDEKDLIDSSVKHMPAFYIS
ncbi:hypothetical protein HHK36_013160 [Tetracentron sinense]|uniref:UDP-glycosyltransferases domain-containing protein n=1 Tax=Tetracentron sinense TaxID=13715 RepID=A0A835DG79_TETSI|nr:hypothetical protein HHK36_013160 [Tetracentron sinense]